MPKAKVLLADDEIPFQLAVGDFLRSQYDVDLVEDAEGVKEKGPAADVLVVDVRLPTSLCEGIEAVGDLLRKNQIRPTVPIVFISIEAERGALPVAALRRCGVPAGRYKWLQKPFELTALANLITDEQNRLRSNRGARPV
jgi:CheY-like chemotaxis protein